MVAIYVRKGAEQPSSNEMFSTIRLQPSRSLVPIRCDAGPSVRAVRRRCVGVSKCSTEIAQRLVHLVGKTLDRVIVSQ